MRLKVLVIDNFDSFVYNLVQYLEDSGAEVILRNNLEISLSEVERFHKILLSPGPGVPSEAGKLLEIIKTFAASKNILGICLGQQAIGEVFGGKLENLNYVIHGESSKVKILTEDEILFSGIENPFLAGRYHSWVVSKNEFPEELEITSLDKNGQIMSLRHRKYDVRGLQFHPESILTPMGRKIIKNWLDT